MLAFVMDTQYVFSVVGTEFSGITKFILTVHRQPVSETLRFIVI